MARRKNTYIFAPERKRRKGPGCLILFLSALLTVVGLTLISNHAMNSKLTLETAKVPVMSLDKAYENFTVLHISDLHGAAVGTDADVWRSLLYGKRFSAVVMTGDMVGTSGDFQPLVALIGILKQINEAAPIYLCAGDDDPPPVVSTYRGTPEVLADWVLEAKKAGAVYLDVPDSVAVGKTKVWFSPEYLYSVDMAGMAQSLLNQKTDMEQRGVQYEAEGGAGYRALCYRLDAMERSLEAVKNVTEKDLQIAVTHVPLDVEYVRTAVEWADQKAPFNFRNVSLVLAGHFVGGQWRLPGTGPVYVPERGWFPGDTGLKGMERINSVNQYVTGGIGASAFYPMPGRLFNTPGVALLTFTAKIE